MQHYSRSVYTFWDFLADVGGLYGSLTELAYPLLWISSLIFGSNLDKFLIESLFKLQKSVDISKLTLNGYIHKRKSFKVKFCNFLCDLKNRRIENKAMHLANDQLDIVDFLQHQMVSKVAIRTLFSKVERYLLAN